MFGHAEYDYCASTYRTSYSEKEEGIGYKPWKGTVKTTTWFRDLRTDVKTTQQGLQKFYEQVMQAIIRHVNFDIVKVIILASPGFTKVSWQWCKSS